eukprot:1194584-Prorocentrum_minimum.AAC.4
MKRACRGRVRLTPLFSFRGLFTCLRKVRRVSKATSVDSRVAHRWWAQVAGDEGGRGCVKNKPLILGDTVICGASTEVGSFAPSPESSSSPWRGRGTAAMGVHRITATILYKNLLLYILIYVTSRITSGVRAGVP